MKLIPTAYSCGTGIAELISSIGHYNSAREDPVKLSFDLGGTPTSKWMSSLPQPATKRSLPAVNRLSISGTSMPQRVGPRADLGVEGAGPHEGAFSTNLLSRSSLRRGCALPRLCNAPLAEGSGRNKLVDGWMLGLGT